jgi:hypothetical protein
MIYRSPFPTKPKDVATKRKIQQLILRQREKLKTTISEQSHMEVELPGDPALVPGNGRREAIQKRLRELRSQRQQLIKNLVKEEPATNMNM